MTVPVPARARLSRRALVQGVAALAAGGAAAQGAPPGPPSAVTQPPRPFGPGAPPTTYPDPDVIAVDPAFKRYLLVNTPIRRLWTGGLWCEGPAWNAQGRYLVWSDLPNDRQMRWLQDDGHVSVFRAPSGNSNGNTFDFQGRQVSCEHLARRVVRHELDGSVTVLAEGFEGRRLNSPNDVAPHPDGSLWFTDPPYGGALYEGAADAAGGPTNPAGRLNPRAGQAAGIGTARRELPTQVYRLDPSGRLARAATEEQVADPNGLCFSPDYRTLYVASTDKGPGDAGPGGRGEIVAFDVAADGTLSNRRRFSDCMVDGVRCGPDGLRCDVDGNVWAGSTAGHAAGYNGVTVWTPEGRLIGRIRLPEACANLCFGGPKRNRLFMAASQSIYALYVNTQGAAPG